MGLNIVHPEGKVSATSSTKKELFMICLQSAKTVFTRLYYDQSTNSSVVHCAHRTVYFLSKITNLIVTGFQAALTPEDVCILLTA